MRHWWLVKTEPDDYSLDDLERDGRAVWDGVRNPVALRHMSTMSQGDDVLVYHTGWQRAIVGVARVERAAYADSSTGETVVDLSFIGRLPQPVSLRQVKDAPELAGWELARLPRLSVMPVPPDALAKVAAWSGNLRLAAPGSSAPR